MFSVTRKWSWFRKFRWVMGRFIRRCVEIVLYCVAFYIIVNAAIVFMNYIGVRVETDTHIRFASNYWRFMFASFIVIFVVVFKYR